VLSAFDEPLGLGWPGGYPAQRGCRPHLQHEARLVDVVDPLAGSYYVESLTDQSKPPPGPSSTRSKRWRGGDGHRERIHAAEVAKSAYERQKRLEEGKT